MLKRFNVKMNKGMTLIELLVVLAIIVIMSAVVMVSPNRSAIDLDSAARQLTSDLRRAQNMAMSAVEQGGIVPCGYGINFNIANKGVYILFADVIGSCNKVYDSGTDIIVDGNSIDLPSGIQISNASSFNVFFETPSGAPNLPSNPFIITLSPTTGGQTRNVSINSAGLIEMQ
jgi:prepilin-type N-terminal cleavage/methylation domain-containing protein